MKRLLIAIIITLIVPAAFAAADSDVLITSDGTVYSVAVEPSDDGLRSQLALTVQSGGKTTRSVIPDSINTGMNTLPNIAYDSDTKSLFVVWMRVPDGLSSELVIANYIGNSWFPVAVIDHQPVVRSNLSIRFTHQVQLQQYDGTYKLTPALILHAAWWEKSGRGEEAYYAVMPLSRGLQTDADIHEMTEFATGPSAADPGVVNDFQRHVALVDGPTADSVDVIYSDVRTNSFYRTTMKPVAEVRIRIPVGVRGGPKLGLPHSLNFDWSGHDDTIASADGNTVIFTNTTDKKVSWVMLRNGDWQPLQEFALSDKVTVNTAMAALAKMAASSE